MNAVILPPGEGEGSDERTTKLSTDAIGVTEFRTDEDSVGDHTHEADEIFYVLKGQMTFRVNGATKRLKAGGFAFVPKRTRHGFAHTKPARYLVISAPGGLERYFEELEEAEKREASDEELERIARRYGTRFLDDG